MDKHPSLTAALGPEMPGLRTARPKNLLAPCGHTSASSGPCSGKPPNSSFLETNPLARARKAANLSWTIQAEVCTQCPQGL
jgi:hypothetical protein